MTPKQWAVSLGMTAVLAVLPFIAHGCNSEGPAKIRRTNVSFYPIKVCSIGSETASGCWTYRAEKYSISNTTLTIKTLEGDVFVFNNAGWAWIITKK